MEIKNLKKAASRIQKAVKNKENIILYGDADLDGVSSVIILKEAIKNLGGKIAAIYFPDREIEGYGINKDALNYLKGYAPALFIALDCGIGNFKEIKMARKLGFEVMVIDHHRILDKIPQAEIIVDPHQKGDRYHFKDFAAAGVVFKLAELLPNPVRDYKSGEKIQKKQISNGAKKKLTPSLKNNFLELVALATLADMMPQIDENLEFLEQGLASLKETLRPGLKVFWQMNSIRPPTSALVGGNIRQFAQKVISACHAGRTKNHLNEGYLLLTSTSIEEAKVLAEYLLDRAYSRHLKIKETTEEIEQRLLKQPEGSIVFEGDKSWEILILGPAASKICQNYKKPVFLYSQKEKESSGAVRTPSGIDGVKAMMHCSKLLETYGGHPQAAGFQIKNENLEKFKDCLVKYFK